MDESCWIPTQKPKPDGYVQIEVRKSNKRVIKYLHRFMYETFKGTVKKDLVIDHLCKERSCCNPSHLEAVSQKINVNRGDTGLYNKIKTHCINGHKFYGENLYYENNKRRCKTCNKIRQRNYKLRKKLLK